ncbi:MAG TPA: BON domain-containing protein [Thermoleophilaceae bacterium]|jgi:osmotically-inducible protein OsmY
MRGKLLITIAGTGAAAYFLDPDQGKRRRNLAQDRVAAFFRQRARGTERAKRAAGSFAAGLRERAKATVREERAPGDDVTLKHKIETELFREPDAPKGSVNIDVAEGVVTLRGQVDRPEQVRDLEAKARSIAGTRDVQNLLHTPDSPPPNVAAVQGSS